MNTKHAKPGDVVVSDFGLYQHWSLVSDRRCEQGELMLISASKRTGTVREEPWLQVTAGNPSYITDISAEKNLPQLLHDARSRIDDWDYSVTHNNCEHFIKWAVGDKRIRSTQVRASVIGTLAGFAFSTLLGRKFRLLKLAGNAALIGGLALRAARASRAKSRR